MSIYVRSLTIIPAFPPAFILLPYLQAGTTSSLNLLFNRVTSAGFSSPAARRAPESLHPSNPSFPSAPTWIHLFCCRDDQSCITSVTSSEVTWRGGLVWWHWYFLNATGSSSLIGPRMTFALFGGCIAWVVTGILCILDHFSCSLQPVKSCSEQKLFLIFEPVTLKGLLHTLKFRLILHFTFPIVGPRTIGPFYNVPAFSDNVSLLLTVMIY